MITITTTNDAPLRFNVHVAGVAAYLDNFALIELAKPSEAARRDRFMTAFMESSGSLLFSGTNGAELAALKGNSASSVRAFLDGFGAHWAFVELDPGRVMEREAAGQTDACLCVDLMHAFFQDRKTELSKATAVLDMSAGTFLRLGAVIDWMGPHGTKMIEKPRPWTKRSSRSLINFESSTRPSRLHSTNRCPPSRTMRRDRRRSPGITSFGTW